MRWERPVSKAKRPFLFSDVDKPTRVGNPQSAPVGNDSNGGINLDRDVRPVQLHPTEIEHLPTTKSCFGMLEGISPRSELDTVVIYIVPNRRSPLGCTNERIGKSLVVLASKKVVNLFDGGFLQGKHKEEKNTALSQRIVERTEEHATLPGEERRDMKQYRTDSKLSSMWYVYGARV